MTADEINASAAEIGALIEERLGLRGRSLRRRVRRAGRLLPRAVAREARYLAGAAEIAGNPRLMPMVDQARVVAAHRIVRDHLRGVDRREARRTRLIGVAAVVVFNLILVMVLALVVLRWRGLI